MEFSESGKLYWAYTGLKRLNGLNLANVPEEDVIGNCTTTSSTVGYYAPSAKAATIRQSIPAGIECTIYGYVHSDADDYVQIEFYDSGLRTYRRAWVKDETVIRDRYSAQYDEGDEYGYTSSDNLDWLNEDTPQNYGNSNTNSDNLDWLNDFNTQDGNEDIGGYTNSDDLNWLDSSSDALDSSFASEVDGIEITKNEKNILGIVILNTQDLTEEDVIAFCEACGLSFSDFDGYELGSEDTNLDCVNTALELYDKGCATIIFAGEDASVIEDGFQYFNPWNKAATFIVEKDEQTSIRQIKQGPILINGTFDKEFELYEANLETGELIRIFSFRNNRNFMTIVPQDQKYIPSYLKGLLFSPDMTKFAVTWRESVDGSYHVGWVDNNGYLFDVTNKVHPSTSSFSSKASNDTSAQFTLDGLFFFCDTNSDKYFYFDTDTLEVVRTEECVHYTYFNSVHSEHNVIILPTGKICRALEKSGGAAEIKIIYPDEYGIGIYSYWSPLTVQAYDFIKPHVAVGVGPYGSMIAKYGEGINELGNYKHYSIDQRNPVYVQITPETDYKIEACAYYNGKIAFTAYRGDTRKLFVIDDAENSTPIEICNLDKSYSLLCWNGIDKY